MSANIDHVDVAVIGGGPAGAMCAKLLARAGARVALVHHERRRPSSIELMSGPARWLVRDIELRGVDVRETISLWDGDQPVVRDSFWDPYGPALAIDRRELDAVLRRHALQAGAKQIDLRVTEISRARRRWCVGSALTAGWIVVATGCGLPGLGRRGRTLLAQRAVLARYRHPGAPRLYIEKLVHGWLYGIPDPLGGTFVGVCTPRGDDLDRAVASSRLMGHIERSSLYARWSCSASVRCYDRVTGPDWIAIGNAAFAPDPLSGGGIWFALESARAAAEVVIGRSSAGAYQARIAAQVQSHLASRQALSAGDGLTVGVQP